MSTSDYGTTGLNDPVSTTGGVQAWEGPPAALGLPDEGMIARLANEFFQAVSGQPTAPALTVDVQQAPPLSAVPVEPPTAPQGEFASLPVAPYVPPTSGVSPPTEAELRAVPASLAGFNGPASSAASSPSPPAAFAQPAEPDYRAIPASLAGVTGLPVQTAVSEPSVAPAGSYFYFLDSAQSSVAEGTSSLPAASSAPPAEAFPAPVEPGLGALPSSLAGVGGLPTPQEAAQSPASSSIHEFRPELVPTEGLTASASAPSELAPPAESRLGVPSGSSALPSESAGTAASGSSLYFLEEASLRPPRSEPNFHFVPYEFSHEALGLPDSGAPERGIPGTR
ncbi:MAG: hypothetical protein PHE55_15000 [Methylococcaceae bacterium]|nr:hypothetical protein [Methylococcaceae bacterium]